MDLIKSLLYLGRFFHPAHVCCLPSINSPLFVAPRSPVSWSLFSEHQNSLAFCALMAVPCFELIDGDILLDHSASLTLCLQNIPGPDS